MLGSVDPKGPFGDRDEARSFDSGVGEEESVDSYHGISPSLARIINEVMCDKSGALEESLTYHFCLTPEDVIAYTEREFEALTMSRTITMTRSRSALSPEAQQALSEDLGRAPLHPSRVQLLRIFKGYVWWYQMEHGR